MNLGSVPNSVVLMFVRGWQGGTIHEIAAELGVTTTDIQNADFDRMIELMRVAQAKLVMHTLDRIAEKRKTSQ